jgi:methionyl-tRNA formyltransferase
MAGLRLVFMGTPAYAVPTLEALIASRHQLVATYSQPPRPRGRGQKARPSPVAQCAADNEITVHTPKSLKNGEAQADFKDLAADLAVTIAYGLILPAEILAAPRLGSINAHASLLPRWRGAAPIQRAIMAGDHETGVTVMQMDAGLDTGPMLLQERTPLGPMETAGTLHDRLSLLSAALVGEAIEGLAAGTLKASPQADAGATYAAKLKKQEAEIDWRASAAEIERRVRAFSPAPGAWFALGDERIKVLAARTSTTNRQDVPGTILDDTLTIACANGSALRPIKVQRGGKAPMPVEAFLRGRPIAPGTRLPCPATS